MSRLKIPCLLFYGISENEKNYINQYCCNSDYSERCQKYACAQS